MLEVLGVALAVACWAALLLLRRYAFGLPVTPAGALTEFVLIAAGSAIFWRLITRTLDRRAAEVQRRTQHLEALHEAGIALTTEHELRAVLQKVVDLSRGLIHARYGALGILDHNGLQIDQFITSGMSPEAQARIGALPKGSGLLGQSLFQGAAVRVPHIAGDPRAAGYPPHHPRMDSFLSVPIVSKGRVFGNLYVADKLPDAHDAIDANDAKDLAPGPSFSEEDQEILEMFAIQAAIAIENAQLYRQNRSLAIMRERERIGMDLHDGVIQSIYAIGLMLDDAQHRLDSEPDLTRERIATAIRGLNGVIGDIRAYIHDLRPLQFRGHDLRQGIEELARELESFSLLTVTVDLDSVAERAITPEQTDELLHIVQESLVNVRKHARAASVQITLRHTDQRIELSVEDDGAGFQQDPAAQQTGHGLRNMAGRAHNLSGALEINSKLGRGTRITMLLPVSPADSPAAPGA